MGLSEAGHLDVGDTRLEYCLHRAAGGDAATIVLLHEGLGCVASWREFPRELSLATGLDVFAYSRAGYGRSSPCALPRPLDYMHEEALEVLPHVLASLDRRPIVLLGHSDGASIAAIHAGARHDTGVRGLILVAPHFYTEDAGIAAIADAARAYRNGELKARLSRYHGNNVECAFRGWSEAWLDPDFRAFDIRDYLPAIDVPVMLIQGEADEYGTAAQVRAARDACRVPLRVEMLARCGHSPHREHPERILALVAEFVRGLQLSCASAARPP